MDLRYILTFERCQELINTPYRKANGLKIANNTRLHLHRENSEGEPTDYHVRLHGNTILIFTSWGVELFSAGWRTVTTRERLNRYSGAAVWQRNWEWFVNGEHDFVEGIFIDSNSKKVWASINHYWNQTTPDDGTEEASE